MKKCQIKKQEQKHAKNANNHETRTMDRNYGRWASI